MNCNSCKWWGTSVRFQKHLRFCNHPKLNEFNSCYDGFSVEDEEPYAVGKFCTGPEFGCVHHEPKDNDPYELSDEEKEALREELQKMKIRLT